MRVGIVNDVAMVVEAISRLLREAPPHEVAWTARSGREAVEQCARDRPDLILMDLVMPDGDGIEATRRIMADTPCPILVVTASVDGQAARAFEALGAGALDVIRTPGFGPRGNGPDAVALLKKIEMLGRLAAGSAERPRPPARALAAHEETTPRGLVAIGASAGGPAALAVVLGALPRDFPVPIILIQHVDAQFAPLMAKWLHEQSAIPVRVAQEGDRPRAGEALLAGTDDHLVFLNAHEVGYTSEPRASSYRPSVDAFFSSVARFWKGPVAGVLLTGMGRDGAKGLKDLREHGALTIAQDRESCVVYGMPKAAAELQAAMEVLSLEAIGPRLARHFPATV